MEVGEKLRERRNILHMTQDEVAEALGVTRQTISNWENGRSYPDIERIIRLSDIYQLSLDELLKGDNKMVHQLQKNTQQNRFVKTFILLLIVNVLLMVGLMLASPLNKIIWILLFLLLMANTFSIFYLIIKKI
ncbi:helix-turn-helix domain-containing protein [Candidatus Enterococcus ferrettii]|uniref:HTH cro/C1-type domain-containing protein n=1 Tax=Candidatus Enterococcus ferrettii TaxID=2815324 RepID=A0ABV0EV09_9ENTE|nr:helix-turn-helix transcriptional regulator [Enterococcus sp. 665A]MBO1341691.1 helix-turn-helix transcriptional regulator [Enterococcus sp. 665A]